MNGYINFESNMLASYNGIAPVEVRGQSNIETQYHKRYLYNKIYSCLDFDFGDLKWDLNSFRFALFHFGSLCLYNHPKFGWVFGAWSPREYNIYMNPATWNFQFFNRKAVEGSRPVQLIGDEKNSVIIKLFDDYFGFDDLVRSTAVQLALLDRNIETASMNANVNLIAFAENKREATTLKTAYGEATKGNPLVVVNKKLKEKLGDNQTILEPFTNHDTALAMDRLLTSRRTILNNFLTEVGIKNANMQKKERLISDEVNSNDEEVSSNITIAYENIKKGFDKFNELSGLNINVDLHFDYETEDNITVVGGGEDV